MGINFNSIYCHTHEITVWCHLNLRDEKRMIPPWLTNTDNGTQGNIVPREVIVSLQNWLQKLLLWLQSCHQPFVTSNAILCISELCFPYVSFLKFSSPINPRHPVHAFLFRQMARWNPPRCDGKPRSSSIEQHTSTSHALSLLPRFSNPCKCLICCM